MTGQVAGGTVDGHGDGSLGVYRAPVRRLVAARDAFGARPHEEVATCWRVNRLSSDVPNRSNASFRLT